MCAGIHTSECIGHRSTTVLDPLELELQAFVTCHMNLLGKQALALCKQYGVIHLTTESPVQSPTALFFYF